MKLIRFLSKDTKSILPNSSIRFKYKHFPTYKFVIAEDLRYFVTSTIKNKRNK